MNFLNRFKYARYVYLLTLLILGIAVMIAYISNRHFVRMDLTEGGQYTISDISKNVMRELDDIVTVRVYFSEKLPPNLLVVRQFVQDLLEELDSYSNGNLNIRFLNPGSEAIAQEALKLGIPMVRMNILEKDKYEVKNGFLGISLSYGANHEIIPVVQDISNLEYDLIASVRKLINLESKAVGFLEGHGEFPLITTPSPQPNRFDEYSLIYEPLSRHYEVRVVSLGRPQDLKDIDTLIVAGPKIAFSTAEKYQLDQFVMNGGNLLVLLDAVQVDDRFEAEVNASDLGDLLDYYGARVEPVLVLDDSNETASFVQGYLSFVVSYPFWVKAVRENFNPTHPITSKLDSVVFPWTSPIVDSKADNGTFVSILSSTDGAWVQEPPFNLDPNIVTSSPVGKRQVLAALLEGPLKSPYARSGVRQTDFKAESPTNARVMVVGNARFIADRSLNQFKQNRNFFLNMVDYLTLDENLIHIRSNDVMDRPLKNLSDAERFWLKMAGIYLIPILIVLYGLIRAMFRRKKPKIFNV